MTSYGGGRGRACGDGDDGDFRTLEGGVSTIRLAVLVGVFLLLVSFSAFVVGWRHASQRTGDSVQPEWRTGVQPVQNRPEHGAGGAP